MIATPPPPPPLRFKKGKDINGLHFFVHKIVFVVIRKERSAVPLPEHFNSNLKMRGKVMHGAWQPFESFE